MSTTDPVLQLDEAVDGVLLSQQPGAFPNQTTFIGRPHQGAMFTVEDRVVEARFLGGVFIHNHPEVVKALTSMSRRGTGIHLLEAADQLNAAKANDELNKVTKEVTKEAIAAAVAASGHK